MDIDLDNMTEQEIYRTVDEAVQDASRGHDALLMWFERRARGLDGEPTEGEEMLCRVLAELRTGIPA